VPFKFSLRHYTPVTPQIDMILLIDREVDMVTPLVRLHKLNAVVDP
jgi:hypothetical protein